MCGRSTGQITSSCWSPIDYAYRASIVALTQEHLLTLTNVQYQELLQQLSSGAEWVSRSGCIRPPALDQQKNPATRPCAPFQALGILRVAHCSTGHWRCGPLLWRPAGGSAAGAGTWAVCCSAARERHWLRVAGYDAHLHRRLPDRCRRRSVLWNSASPQRHSPPTRGRRLARVVAIEAAVLVRYTNVAILAVAVLAVLLVLRRASFRCAPPAGGSGRSL